jgi:hypothetical protein
MANAMNVEMIDQFQHVTELNPSKICRFGELKDNYTT